MKRSHFCLTIVLLLLLIMSACRNTPAKSGKIQCDSETPTGSKSHDGNQTANSGDLYTPVTTENEIRALYALDYTDDPTNPPILSVTAYKGDFLVQRGWEGSGQWLDWVYGKSGIRYEMMYLDEPLLDLKILRKAAVKAVIGGPNSYNGVPSFPHVETATLDFICDEQGIPLDCFPYSGYGTSVSSTYWADSGETYYMGMQERREAVRSAQIDAGGVTVAFAPLADGSDFTAAYCEIPYTKISFPENGIVIFVRFHNTFLDSGELADGVTTDYLKIYGSLYPEDFPAGELTGNCLLIEKAEITQEKNDVVLTITLNVDRLSETPLGDEGFFQYTADRSYTGMGDVGPYFHIQIRVADDFSRLS